MTTPGPRESRSRGQLRAASALPAAAAAPTSAEEEHRRRWLQYVLQTPAPGPLYPANRQK